MASCGESSHASEVTAKALTQYLLSFLYNKGISLHKIRGLGFDRANTVRRVEYGCMRCVVPNALYINCHSHKLQLVAVYSATMRHEGKRV